MKIAIVLGTFLAMCQLTYSQSEIEHYSLLINKYKFDEYPVDIKCKQGSISESLKLEELNDLPTNIKSNILIQFKNSDNYIGSCYKYAIWSCGNPCQMLAIFRISSGELIGTLTASLGFLIEQNSRLILTNPPIKQELDIEYRQTIGEPKFFELLNDEIVEAENN